MLLQEPAREPPAVDEEQGPAMAAAMWETFELFRNSESKPVKCVHAWA